MTHHVQQTLKFRNKILISLPETDPEKKFTPTLESHETGQKRFGLVKEIQRLAQSKSCHLLTQVIDLCQVLALKKLIRKKEGRSILEFTKCTLLKANNANAKKVLGYILFLIQINSGALLELIKTESTVSKMTRLSSAVCGFLREAKERILKTHAMHVKCPIQNIKSAKFEQVCSELAKALVLENGNLNLSIKKLAEKILIPSILRGFPKLTNLNRVLNTLEHNCLSKVNTLDWNSPSELALKLYLGIDEKCPITNRHKKMLFLSSLFGFEGNFHDLIEKVAKPQSLTNMETLENELEVTSNAQIVSKKGKHAFLFHAPGVVKACTVLGIQNVKETLLNVLNRMPERFSIKNLLRQLANYAYMQQEFSLSIIAKKDKYSPEEFFQSAKIAFIIQENNPLLLCIKRTIKEKKLYFSETRKRSIFVEEILGSAHHLRRACLASSSDKIFPNRSN